MAWIVLTGVLVLAQGCGGLASIDGELFPPPPRDAITFWGHATCYIDVEGYGIVTDPVFERAMVFRRRKVPIPPPASYAGARLILLSHSHNDHLSGNTLETFPEDVTILCPEPAAKHLRDLGREVRVMRPGDEFEYPGGRVVAVAAHHAGSRWSLAADHDGRALGYVIYTTGQTVYWTGDTTHFPGFGDVATSHRPDITIIDINGHLHGTDAVLASFATRAHTIIPIHHGAYGYLFWREQKGPRDVEEMKRMLGPMLVVPKLGQSIPLNRQAPALP